MEYKLSKQIITTVKHKWHAPTLISTYLRNTCKQNTEKCHCVIKFISQTIPVYLEEFRN